jgi:hypothetical protein
MDGVEGGRKIGVFLPKKLSNFIRVIQVKYVPDSKALFAISSLGRVKHNVYGVRHIHMKSRRLWGGSVDMLVKRGRGDVHQNRLHLPTLRKHCTFLDLLVL